MFLPVTKIQRFSTHDGPGIRTTVFLKGCPLRCIWCHNPEAQSCRQQIFYTPSNCIWCSACMSACPNGAHLLNADGTHLFDVKKCTGCLNCAKVCPSNAIEPVSKLMTCEEIFNTVIKDMAFYGDIGGLTLSGGEPLMHPEGCFELLMRAKDTGITTAIETSGYFDSAYIHRLAEVVDLFLWDFKDGNAQRHKKNTGVTNEKILQNLFLLDKKATKILLRCIMVKGINMDDSNLEAIARTAVRLEHCVGVELLPYHAYGGSKNKQMGYEENGNKDWVPSAQDLKNAKEKLLEFESSMASLLIGFK